MLSSTGHLLNISTNHLFPKMLLFLRHRGKDDIAMRLEKSGGCCEGLTVNFLYAMWLKNNKEKGVPPIRDLYWFNDALTQLAEWDEKPNSINKHDRWRIERLLAKVDYYQNITHHEPSYHDQGWLDRSLKNFRKEHARLEYTLAGVFAPDDLNRQIRTDTPGQEYTSILRAIAPPHRLVHIGCHKHATGLYFDGDNYHYYDCGTSDGVVSYPPNKLDKLEKHIFIAHCYDKMAQLGFSTFSFDPIAATYPHRSAILKTLTADPFFTTDIPSQHTILSLAHRIRCKESYEHYKQFRLDIYFYRKPDPSDPDIYFSPTFYQPAPSKQTPVTIAAAHTSKLEF